MKNIGWDRKLWGVMFVSKYSHSKRRIIGEAWHKYRPAAYPSEPLRALLFQTRKAARAWCNNENEIYSKRLDCCRHWRCHPIRVRETITPIAKTAVEK